MADHDQYNDEYQYADLDSMNPDAAEENENTEIKPPSESKASGDPLETYNIKRNALIVVGVVLAIMILYKLIGAIFSDKKVPVKQTIIPVVVSKSIADQPPITPSQPPLTSSDTKITEVLSTLDAGQQSMQTEISAVSGQLGGITNSINDMTAKIAELNGIIANLNAKVEEQSREMEKVAIRHVSKKVSGVRYTVRPNLKYHIQAVIPGRAWLIATNGSTLTVREGTLISGYGMVKLIDPNQGRVTTSSGQVIKFSQEDS